MLKSETTRMLLLASRRPGVGKIHLKTHKSFNYSAIFVNSWHPEFLIPIISLFKYVCVCVCVCVCVHTHKHTHTLTYLLTPWCRVLLEKLAGLQLVKKFPAFYGTRRFITAFTSFRHPSLSWASPIQSPYPQSTFQVPNLMSLRILPNASPRNTPPRRSEWGSSLPPDWNFVSTVSIVPVS